MGSGRRLGNRQDMALADIPRDEPSRRLDSWKEIAEYLRRDVRTATRWESQGLPLHRIAGGKGRSVFAFTHEIDAWMAGRSAEPEVGHEVIDQAPEALVPASPTHLWRTIAIGVTGALVGLAVGAVVMTGGSPARLNVTSLQVTETPTHLSITDASGASRIVHQFAPGAKLREGGASRVVDIDGAGEPDVLAMVSFYDPDAGRAVRSGELLDLSTEGITRWRFAFNEVMTFADGSAPGPWSVVDWQPEPVASPKRIAVAAHDMTWWASAVTTLDHRGQRLGSFVNPGWIESVMWHSSERLAVAGFHNPSDSAMFAMLDANHLQGQAPGSAGTEFVCVTCSTAAPLFYATFPRSELNQITASRFNRARVSMTGDHIVVTTVEMPREFGDVTAFYEFDRDLRLVHARYSDLYWSEHQRLELEGRITHTREACPSREGPRAIEVWDAARGWIRTTPSSAR